MNSVYWLGTHQEENLDSAPSPLIFDISTTF